MQNAQEALSSAAADGSSMILLPIESGSKKPFTDLMVPQTPPLDEEVITGDSCGPSQYENVYDQVKFGTNYNCNFRPFFYFHCYMF